MPASATLFDFNDRELLWILYECADGDGVIRVADVARSLNVTHQRRNQCVGSRLARLRQLGIVQLVTQGKWTMTQKGEDMMRGKLKAAEERMMEGMTAEALYDLTSAVTRKMRNMDSGTSRLIEREWRHGTHRPPKPRPLKTAAK